MYANATVGMTLIANRSTNYSESYATALVTKVHKNGGFVATLTRIGETAEPESVTFTANGRQHGMDYRGWYADIYEGENIETWIAEVKAALDKRAAVKREKEQKAEQDRLADRQRVIEANPRLFFANGFLRSDALTVTRFAADDRDIFSCQAIDRRERSHYMVFTLTQDVHYSKTMWELKAADLEQGDRSFGSCSGVYGETISDALIAFLSSR